MPPNHTCVQRVCRPTFRPLTPYGVWRCNLCRWLTVPSTAVSCADRLGRVVGVYTDLWPREADEKQVLRQGDRWILQVQQTDVLVQLHHVWRSVLYNNNTLYFFIAHIPTPITALYILLHWSYNINIKISQIYIIKINIIII